MKASRSTDRGFPWPSLILPALIVLLWYALARAGTIPPFIFPSPGKALATIVELARSGSLLVHTAASLQRAVMGFAIALAMGVVWGTVIGFSKRTESVTGLALMMVAPIPPFAWFPLAILWFGMGEASKLFVVVVGAFFPIFLHVVSGIRSTDQKYVEVAKVFEKSKLALLTQVYFPATLPSLLVGVRMGAVIAWITLAAAEMISGTQGLGYLIIHGRQLVKPDVIVTAMIVMGAIGALLDRLVVAGGDHLLAWQDS